MSFYIVDIKIRANVDLKKTNKRKTTNKQKQKQNKAKRNTPINRQIKKNQKQYKTK